MTNSTTTTSDNKKAPSQVTCHCKSIRLTFPPISEPALECFCSICRRYGALWAYYKPEEVKVEVEDDAIEGYSHGRKAISFNRCKKCGCMTHYSIVPGMETVTEPRVAVNCRMLKRKEFRELESFESEGEGEDEE